MRKYKQLAEKIIFDIQTDKLKHGDRMISLRLFAQQHQVSVSTAVSCYEELEKRGWISARPQSGFFICSQNTVLPAPQWQSFSTEIAKPVRPCVEREVRAGPLGMACLEPDSVAKRALDKSLRKGINQSTAKLSQYPSKQGESLLRKALSEHFGHTGFALHPDELVITHGCMDAVKTALMLCTRAGDAVAVSSPCYNGLLDLLSQLELNVIEIPSLEDGIDLDTLERLFAEKQVQAGLFCTTHMNPQGITMTPVQKKRLCRLATQYHIPVIEDDVYFELNHSDKYHLPTAYYDESGYIIWCGSFSKTLSPGYRLGWCRPGNFLLKYQQQYQGVPTLIQLAIADFIQSGAYSKHLKRARQQLAENKRNYTHYLAERLPEHSRITQPDGGLVLWIEVPGLDSKALHYAAANAGLDLRCGHLFTESDRYGNCLRINIGFELTEQIQQLLDTLLSLIQQSCTNSCLQRQPA